MAEKNESHPSHGALTGLIMNFESNESAAWLYIIPTTRNSEKSATLNRWNYPVSRFTLHNFEFLDLAIRKEINVRQSTLGFPCSEIGEEHYYQVKCR